MGKTWVGQTGEHGAIWACGKHLSLLMICLLMAALASRLPSSLRMASSCLKGNEGPNVGGGAEGEGLDSCGAVLCPGECHVLLGSCKTLTTFLVSCCHGTFFAEDWTAGTDKGRVGVTLSGGKAVLAQGKSCPVLI